MKLFESNQDLINELEVAEKFAESGLTKTEILKLPQFGLDFLLHSLGKARAFIEVKCYTTTFDQFPTQILSCRKVDKMKEYAKILPTYFVCRYSCGTIAFINQNYISGNIRKAGRKPRAGSSNDIENCIFIPRKHFTKLC